jgi:glycosyltransferase involved in cell wall biosynthesis
MRSGEAGGAEVLFRELHDALGRCGAEADLVEVDCDESDFDTILRTYARCYDLELDAYDLVISTKAPTFMVRHRNHVSLLVHTIRVFYDRFDAEFPRPTPELLDQRRQIQRLDLEAFGHGLIRARFAIGEPVAARLEAADPGWKELPFRVLHLPPRMRGEAPSRPGEHFLLAGRLHRWKRVDLAIQAVRRLPGSTLLHIVGAGEDEGRFRDAAGGDPRIRFHGQVSDAELDDLYASCIAVPFVPVEEDFGFITVEAFAHGRPVVTCTDSGHPRCVVEESGGGLVVAPEPVAIAEALARLRDDPKLARRLGERGRSFALSLSWDEVARTLLAAGGFEPAGRGRGLAERRSALTIAVLDTQPIEPPVGGGRLRLHGLYRTLDEDARAIYVGSYDWRGPSRRTVAHGERLEERTIPHSEEHFAAADALQRLCGGQNVIDVTQPLLAPLSQELLAEAHAAMAEADVVVFSHPWLYPPLADEVRRRGLPVIYDSQNFEWRLRRELLGKTPLGAALADAIRFWEGEICRRADLVFVCSAEDRDGFVESYGVDRGRIEIVPNGVDTDSIRPAEATQRQAARLALGLSPDALVALFIGSDYEPNREAARWIADTLARTVPPIEILLVGGACEAVKRLRTPRNVHLLGVVDDATKLRALHAADLAINPVTSGSGTNIKMFDFMAAGVPIVSTPVGARGIDPGSPEAFVVVERDHLSTAIERLAGDRTLRTELADRGRSLACDVYDWRNISRRVAALARRLVPPAGAPTVLRRPPAATVVIPSFNRPDRLQELLRRLSGQTFRDFEVVIVEQGPRASELAIDPRLEVRHIHTPIRGAVRARNTGIELARGGLIAFIDDDCLPGSTWLETLLRPFNDPDVVAVEGLVVPDRPDANPKKFRIVTNHGFEGIGFMTANLGVRTAAARRIGGFDEIFDHPHFREDTDFGWRLAELGRIPFSQEARVIHPVLPRSEERESAEERARFFEKDPLLFEKHPRRYLDLFVAEGNYLKIDGFWAAFERGIERYGLRIEPTAFLRDARVVVDALPAWIVATAPRSEP